MTPDAELALIRWPFLPAHLVKQEQFARPMMRPNGQPWLAPHEWIGVRAYVRAKRDTGVFVVRSAELERIVRRIVADMMTQAPAWLAPIRVHKREKVAASGIHEISR